LVLDAGIVKVKQGGLRGSLRIVDRDLPRNLLDKARYYRVG